MILAPEAIIRKYTEQGSWGDVTLDQQFALNVAENPDALALVDAPNRRELTFGAPQRLTYAALDQAVSAAAAMLLRAGIGKDDIVAFQLPNIVEAVVLLLACARIGAIASPLLVQFDTHELALIFAKLGPKIFLSVSRFKNRDLAAAAESICRQHHCALAAIDHLDIGAREPSPADRSLLEAHLSAVSIDANDIYTVCWTSGTEGRPKGVMRSHNNWLWNGRCLFEAFALRRGDAILNIRPLVNMAAIGGSFMSWLLTGGRLVLHHPLDIRLALEQIRTEGVNLAYMPPAFFMSLLADASLASRADLSSLRVLGTGSAALPAQAIERMERDYGIEIVNVFGSNEGVGLLSRRLEIPDPAYRASFFPRCGCAEVEWPNLPVSMQQESRLVDPATNKEITEAGRAGELRMRGPGIFPGYIGEEELNKKSFDDQGFYCTGDLFEIAGEGTHKKYYKFVGRLKEIIVRGGIKIAPAELDEVISRHPLLKEAAFFGYADDRLGEKVGLAVVPSPGSRVSLADVIAFMKQTHVAVYKLPERLLVLDELPRNAMLKVVRRRLTEMAAERAVEG